MNLARERFPELKELDLPPRGGLNEIRSLRFQSRRISTVDYSPAEDEVSKVVKEVLKNYPTSTLPVWLEQQRLPTRSEVRDYFPHISRTASPGLPWAEFKQTKGELLDDQSDLVIDMVLCRLKILMSIDLIEDDARVLLRSFMMDPIRLFIKDEPHSAEKIANQRYRLISSCSIVDEIIFGMICVGQNTQEISFNPFIPSKCGMGLITEEQTDQLFAYAEPWLDKATSSDVRGWDWSMKPWMFHLVVKTQIALTKGQSNPFYTRLINNITHCLTHSMFVTSCGRMFVLRAKGIMKSGFPITASWNSRVRYMCTVLAGSTAAMTMGDDCNEATDLTPEEFVTKYASLGLTVTGVLPADGQSFSFCSHTFTKKMCVPENPWKTYFNFLNNSPDDPTFLQAFKLGMRNHPRLNEFIEAHKEFVAVVKSKVGGD